MSLSLTYPAHGAAFVAGGGVIGRAVVERFARAGVPVLLGYLGNAERADAIAVETTAACGTPVTARRVDLRSSVEIVGALDFAVQAYGRVHTVVYASGPTLQFAPVRELPPDRVEAFILGDTMCCYRLFHHALAYLAAGGGGSLVSCATLANYRVIDNDALSSLPKAAIESLVRQIAAEEAPRGIRANAIGVGWIGGWANTFAEARAACAQMPTDVAAKVTPMIEQMISLIRMQRPGSGGDAADLIAYLASDQALYITGQTVGVDGGASL
jgi:3-oxoacyl-[acyl-carrier protein] reductase